MYFTMLLLSRTRPTFVLFIIAIIFVIVSLLALLSIPPVGTRKVSKGPVQQRLFQAIRDTPSAYTQTHILRKSSEPSNINCVPHKKLVFLKTHKTGSTTLASIIQRYGYLKNLTFLVPHRNHFLNYQKIFNADKINLTEVKDTGEGPWTFRKGYDILTNHARYNRTSMDRVFHGVRYVTILREPSAQFESAFYYFEIWRSIPRSREPLKLFMEDPELHFKNVMRTRQYYKSSMHNQHLYDFGMSHDDMNDDVKVRSKIREIDADFDLVMITEYFDESLLLLRKLLCWSMDDILYLAKGTRTPDYHGEVGPDLRNNIQAWNKADVSLYAHFNHTFWRKVRQYGSDFEKDLAEFRDRLADTHDTCCNNTRQNSKDRRVVLFSLKNNPSTWCRHVARGDVDFTNLIRERMLQHGIPTYDNRESHKRKKNKLLN
ncbi:galactosylceramide sulfotransferase-like [Strongylocentrotus purpuratus]|uniref:Galactosylceramide sulfotransferase n=1 Tax=Strongylocentrotus purpuratus TaxID=7668 RepID=A0A7M7SX62_STRPU|nr:galactosylceramide sulfotransferase-like [Strongylocentrotus purpuratus]XP_030837878.1 galactosylceramide sulfotransferase-like [Strongylocentrotus purpuratus]